MLPFTLCGWQCVMELNLHMLSDFFICSTHGSKGSKWATLNNQLVKIKQTDSSEESDIDASIILVCTHFDFGKNELKKKKERDVFLSNTPKFFHVLNLKHKRD